MEALRSYQAKALAVNSRTNSVVGWVEGALEQAQNLDTLRLVETLATKQLYAFVLFSPSERGPLHGVPVSVKECYDLAGTYSTAGMIK